MDIKTFYHSKDFKRTSLVLLVVVIILLAFGIGIQVGERRAEFGEHFGGVYSRMFVGRPPLGYGAAGKVISVSKDIVTLELGDNSERLVHVGPDTLIRYLHDSATTADLKGGDSVIVIGSPSASGTIEARLIRIVE